MTVDQPPPPLPEASSTGAEDAAAAATAADVDDEEGDDEASFLSPDAVPDVAPGAAAQPPADQAELTKPDELLSDGEGFCVVFVFERLVEERQEEG